MDERNPCPGCGRLYGHLVGCRVEELHIELDRLIRSFGVGQVRIALKRTQPPRRYGTEDVL